MLWAKAYADAFASADGGGALRCRSPLCPVWTSNGGAVLASCPPWRRCFSRPGLACGNVGIIDGGLAAKGRGGGGSVVVVAVSWHWLGSR